MPQHARGVLEDAQVGGHVCGIVLDHWPAPVIPRVAEQPPELGEACEAPVALVGREAVVCCVGQVHGGVIWIPQNKHELDASIPLVGHALVLVALLEVEGGKVDIVAKGKEEDAPGMAGALEDGALLAAGEGAPVPDFPGMMGLGFCFVVGQLWHVLGEEGIVLVGAGLGLDVDFVHVVVGVWGDDGDTVLLVVLGVDEHVAPHLGEAGR